MNKLEDAQKVRVTLHGMRSAGLKLGPLILCEVIHANTQELGTG